MSVNLTNLTFVKTLFRFYGRQSLLRGCQGNLPNSILPYSILPKAILPNKIMPRYFILLAILPKAILSNANFNLPCG